LGEHPVPTCYPTLRSCDLGAAAASASFSSFGRQIEDARAARSLRDLFVRSAVVAPGHEFALVTQVRAAAGQSTVKRGRRMNGWEEVGARVRVDKLKP